MIQYEKSIEFSGDLNAAMAMAKTIFATQGFKVIPGSDNSLSLTGPGMRSTRQNPIRGLTRGELKFTNSTLEFSGELGGVEFMKKFLYLFPAALGIGLTILFVVQAYLTKQNLLTAFTPILAVVPWLFLSPFMAKHIQKKSEEAVETALWNISKA